MNNMSYKSTYENLVSKGYVPQQPLVKRKAVVTQERNVKYTLDIHQQPSTVFQVDGDIVKYGLKFLRHFIK